MPAPDPTNVLFKIAHPDLYERNPFNVLNLSVDATAKDIRRRREDIEAAFDAGTEADEFAGMIPADDGRKTPTRAEVDDLFAALEDPERRIAYKLFWFWPTETDPATAAKSKRDPNAAYRHTDAVRTWENRALASPRSESVVERHNLAVYSHLMALYGEQSSRQRTAQQVSADVDNHWRDGIRWWNDLAGDPELWHSVSESVTALNDPRLDYRFARSLRDQFAYAFDQINVELAIEFAKTGREADAKRQVAYMKLSQPGSDDVEGTFDDAFAGLLKQTEAIVDAALAEAKAKPKDGLKQANAVLNQTAEPLRVSRIVLDKGSPVRDAIVSAVFAGVRGCLIAYGNETKNWDECLKLTEKLKGIAETEEQKKKAEEDETIILRNRKDSVDDNRCWFCGNPIHDHYNALHILLTKPAHVERFHINRTEGQVTSRASGTIKIPETTKSVSIPCCHDCRNYINNKCITPSRLFAHPMIQQFAKEGFHLDSKSDLYWTIIEQVKKDNDSKKQSNNSRKDVCSPSSVSNTADNRGLSTTEVVAIGLIALTIIGALILAALTKTHP